MKSRYFAIILVITSLILAIAGCGGGGGGAAPLPVTNNQAPSISTQPASLAIAAGNKAQFTVNASGAGLTYQWQVKSGAADFTNITDGGVYSGATTTTLTITGITPSLSGNSYRVIVNGTVNQ